LLALTPIAAEAIQSIVKQSGAPEGSVLRIFTEETGNNGNGPSRDLRLALSRPQDDDTVVEGLDISLDPETADFLDDKVLDAEVDQGDVRFNLYQQPMDGEDEESGTAQHERDA
jgi:Fe-S cluster assembly iron-binding protein IscA